MADLGPKVQGRVLCYARVRPTIDFGDGIDEGSIGPRAIKVDKEKNVAKMSGFFGTPSKSLDNLRQSITQKEYEYDGVFDESSSQQDVYEALGRPVLKDVLRGFHGCVLAYGQTGSGKTYSLLNTAEDGDITGAGLLARLASELFIMFESDPDSVYTVSVSFCQLYNEQIDDLLNPASNLKLVPNPEEGGWAVSELSWHRCVSAEALMQCVADGRKNIAYAETNMNKQSSRSHAVLQLRINKYPRRAAEAPTSPGEGDAVQVFKGKLTVVDLAGSERVKKSQAEGVRLQEATRINTSLLAFGQVVQALARRQAHVPYRDAYLTKMLEDSMSGSCCTRLLVCVSPSNSSANETLSTLEFGTRAMKVKIAPKVYVATETLDPSVLAQSLATGFRDEALQHSHKAIQELEGRVVTAQGELAHASNTVTSLQERVMDLEMELESMRAENEEQREQISSLQGDVSTAEGAHASAEEEKGMLLKEMERLVGEMESLVAESRRLKAENDKHAAHADFLSADKEAAAARLARLERQSREDREKAAELEARVAKSEREKEALAVMAAKGRQGAAALLLALRRFTDAEQECAALQLQLLENSGELVLIKMKLAEEVQEGSHLKEREAELVKAREDLLGRLEDAERVLAGERERHEAEVAEYKETNEKLQELMGRMQATVEGSSAAIHQAEARYEKSLRAIGARAGQHIESLETSLQRTVEREAQERKEMIEAKKEELEAVQEEAQGCQERAAAAEKQVMQAQEARDGLAKEFRAAGEKLREGLLSGGVGAIKIGRNGKRYHRLVRLQGGKVEWAPVGDFKGGMELGATPKCALSGGLLVLEGPRRALKVQVESELQREWALAALARFDG